MWFSTWIDNIKQMWSGLFDTLKNVFKLFIALFSGDTKGAVEKLMATFKELNDENNVDKQIKKAGLSLAIIFSKEDIKRFDLNHDDVIRLNNAQIIKKKEGKSI